MRFKRNRVRYKIKFINKNNRNINSVKASFKELYKNGHLKSNGDFIYDNKIVALFAKQF